MLLHLDCAHQNADDKHIAFHQAHMERSSSMETPNENSSKTVVRILMEEVMSLKVREARAVINLRECEQKVMELETQVDQ